MPPSRLALLLALSAPAWSQAPAALPVLHSRAAAPPPARVTPAKPAAAGVAPLRLLPQPPPLTAPEQEKLLDNAATALHVERSMLKWKVAGGLNNELNPDSPFAANASFSTNCTTQWTTQAGPGSLAPGIRLTSAPPNCTGLLTLNFNAPAAGKVYLLQVYVDDPYVSTAPVSRTWDVQSGATTTKFTTSAVGGSPLMLVPQFLVLADTAGWQQVAFGPDPANQMQVWDFHLLYLNQIQ